MLFLDKLKAVTEPYRWFHYMLTKADWRFQEVRHAKLFYSQFGEDIILDSIFNQLGVKEGFYVDVGAFHPAILSNTCYFRNKGWRGINIEPNPSNFPRFEKQRPEDINLNLAISRGSEPVEFVCDGAYSGIKDDTHLFADRAEDSTTVIVDTRPLREVLSEHLPSEETTIEFLSVDCEGHDLEVMRSNDWERFRPKAILIEEHHEVAEPTRNFLNSISYQFYCRAGLTSVYLEQEIAPQFLPAS